MIGSLNHKKQTDMEKFARVCDITNEGMNEGYCIGDGFMYIKHESDMVEHVKSVGYSSLDEAYDDDYYYWTEWEELDDDYHYLEDGTLIETINN